MQFDMGDSLYPIDLGTRDELLICSPDKKIKVEEEIED